MAGDGDSDSGRSGRYRTANSLLLATLMKHLILIAVCLYLIRAFFICGNGFTRFCFAFVLACVLLVFVHGWTFYTNNSPYKLTSEGCVEGTRFYGNLLGMGMPFMARQMCLIFHRD